MNEGKLLSDISVSLKSRFGVRIMTGKIVDVGFYKFGWGETSMSTVTKTAYDLLGHGREVSKSTSTHSELYNEARARIKVIDEKGKIKQFNISNEGLSVDLKIGLQLTLLYGKSSEWTVQNGKHNVAHAFLIHQEGKAKIKASPEKIAHNPMNKNALMLYFGALVITMLMFPILQTRIVSEPVAYLICIFFYICIFSWMVNRWLSINSLLRDISGIPTWAFVDHQRNSPSEDTLYVDPVDGQSKPIVFEGVSSDDLSSSYNGKKMSAADHYINEKKKSSITEHERIRQAVSEVCALNSVDVNDVKVLRVVSISVSDRITQDVSIRNGFSHNAGESFWKGRRIGNNRLNDSANIRQVSSRTSMDVTYSDDESAFSIILSDETIRMCGENDIIIVAHRNMQNDDGYIETPGDKDDYDAEFIHNCTRGKTSYGPLSYKNQSKSLNLVFELKRLVLLIFSLAVAIAMCFLNNNIIVISMGILLGLVSLMGFRDLVSKISAISKLRNSAKPLMQLTKINKSRLF